MNAIFKNIKWLIISLVSILLSWATYQLFYTTNIEKEQQRFQKEFTVLERKQASYKEKIKPIIKSSSINQLWENELLKQDFLVLCYAEDSIIYWNNNQVSFTQSHAGSNSYFVANLRNGYYLVDKFRVDDKLVYIASKLKNQFYYQNEALQNTISDVFSTTNNLEIEFRKTPDNYPILSLDKSEIFFIKVLKSKTINKYQQLLIFGLYLIGVLALLIGVSKMILYYAQKNKFLIFLFPTLLIGLRYFSIKQGWLQLFNEFKIFEPDLYANSTLIPNLGSFILTLSLIVLVVWWFLHFLPQIKEKTKTGIVSLIIVYLITLVYARFISLIFESLIVNSSIPLVIDEVFTLNVYSFIVLFIIAVLFLSYYIIVQRLSIKLEKTNINSKQIFILWTMSSIAFVLFEYFYSKQASFYVTWPIIINGLLLLLAYKKQPSSQLKYNLLIISIFSFYGAIALFENNQQNEHLKRELYANQLITDQDPMMEIEYAETIENLVNNPEFYQLLDGASYFSSPNFAMQIENCCFGSFWERYEIEFFFFDEQGTALFEYVSGQNKTQEGFQRIIEKHATPSEIAGELYFVNDYYDQLSYVGYKSIQTLKKGNLDFYILFKSKKIPESIGFPRLLMNEKSYALQDLEGYSIARYSNNRLVMRFGSYNYPIFLNEFKDEVDHKGTFQTVDGTSHMIYRQAGGQGVIISKPAKKWIQKISTFSYLVLFFGIFSLATVIIVNRRTVFPIRSFHISYKVQAVLIGMVVGTFVIFAVVAIENVTRQYNANTTDNLKEKINSVETVVGQQIGSRENLTIHADYMNYTLKRLAKVFVTDINFYEINGSLFATSQGKIYDKGISSRMMNNDAFYALKHQQTSEFIHLESFGELAFLSGYVPFKNDDGKLLGYLNIQHFSKQNVFEKQMNDFIVAVINVGVLLMVISVILAIIISGWVTTPLRLIQQSFSEVELGKENKPIAYKGDDEIGALVKDYNDKLAELELKALQLAKTERETAWREMAKQIAHEIKNPLTPMKLSIQHFQRSFDPNAENAKEKIQRMVDSLVEQIDALTKIANEFSNFAKMPKANEEKLNLTPILQNIADLYSSSDVEVNLQIKPEENIRLFADKNLILRAFNNLIKNAIQAKKDNENIKITISSVLKDNYYTISIKDNGVGVPDDIRDKMFVPNFTTKTTGSGLGLAMVKQIVTTHNGELWFESEEGKGTTFFVKLPRSDG